MTYPLDHLYHRVLVTSDMEDVTLIKAWIPTPLHRAVKSAASQLGLTIQDFVTLVLRGNQTVRAQPQPRKRNGKEKR